MKKQIAGLLTGLLVCSAFLTGCGKNEATEAVKAVSYTHLDVYKRQIHVWVRLQTLIN